MKKAIITGISGQDGSYLAEYLLKLGYEVHGIVRRTALEAPSHHFWRIRHTLDKITLHAGSLEAYPSLFRIIREVQPDECYHLAAQSFVSYSFEDEFETMTTNANGTHCILSVLKTVCPQCHFYFAGTSEMFGSADVSPQNENTRFRPRSIYGISKVAGFDLTRNYRDSYGLFACSGILYNHESPRRGFEFVTRKITLSAAKIKLGLAKELRLGNIEAQRDWGYSGDYVKAMHAMLSTEKADDFVIATGQTHTVKEFISIAFSELGLDYQEYLIIDPKLFRPAENIILTGDASKARKLLHWKPSVNFEKLVLQMVRSDFEYVKKQIG